MNNNVNITDATFTSVWDDTILVTTECKVNLESKEVFDIQNVDIEGVDSLDREYITIDGEEYPVSREGEDDTEYWYK